MKLRPASLQQFANGNVFDACDDAYLADSVLDELAILNSPHHSFNLKDGVKNVILDKSAPDYELMFVEKGQPLAADEILESLKPLVLKIPLRARSEFRCGQLPKSELLMAIQYYASHTSMRKYSMNESALLALGMLVEQWADEMVDDDAARTFLEMEDDEQRNGEALLSEKYLSISDPEDQSIMDHWIEEESDSDVMSVDLEESDTDEEVRELDPTKPLEGVHAIRTSSKRRRSSLDSSRIEMSAEDADESSGTSSESESENSSESESESSEGSSEKSSNENSTNDSSEDDEPSLPQISRLTIPDSQFKLGNEHRSVSDLPLSDPVHSSLSELDDSS